MGAVNSTLMAATTRGEQIASGLACCYLRLSKTTQIDIISRINKISPRPLAGGYMCFTSIAFGPSVVLL